MTTDQPSEPKPLRYGHTDRGFRLIEFSDANGEACSLQKSSSALEDKVWLGRDDRMHLTRAQVMALLPVLTHFVATGELP